MQCGQKLVLSKLEFLIDFFKLIEKIELLFSNSFRVIALSIAIGRTGVDGFAFMIETKKAPFSRSFNLEASPGFEPG